MTDGPGYGLFITFEGGDGSGKTTQAERLVARLRREAYRIILTHEPSGTELGRRIKRLFEQAVLEKGHLTISPLSELLLFAAARAQNVTEIISPALARGDIVVCDRFSDSTIAYQGYGRGLDLGLVRSIDRVVTEGITPDLTLLLDVPIDAALARADPAGEGGARAKALDAMGQESHSFHLRVREGFLALAGAEPERICVVDANAPAEAVEEAVWQRVQALLAPRRQTGNR